MTVANNGGGSRQYRSDLRDRQALQTRVTILAAAADLFVRQGFASTTMRDIASAAGVSVESVYAQGTKSALLRACVDRALVDDDEEDPLADRAEFRAMVQATNGREVLRHLRELVDSRQPSALPIMYALYRAAAVDPELAAHWAVLDGRRHQDVALIARALEGSLRPGVSVARATDVLWLILSVPIAHMLEHDRGWSDRECGEWQVDALERLLLD